MSARTIAHTMTFTFEAINKVSAIANTVVADIKGLQKAAEQSAKKQQTVAPSNASAQVAAQTSIVNQAAASAGAAKLTQERATNAVVLREAQITANKKVAIEVAAAKKSAVLRASIAEMLAAKGQPVERRVEYRSTSQWTPPKIMHMQRAYRQEPLGASAAVYAARRSAFGGEPRVLEQYDTHVKARKAWQAIPRTVKPGDEGADMTALFRTKQAADQLAGPFGMQDKIFDIMSGKSKNLARDLRDVGNAMKTGVSSGVASAKEAQVVFAGIGHAFNNSTNPAMQANNERVQRWINFSERATKAAALQKGSLVELAGAYNALVVVKHVMAAMVGVLQPAMEMETALSDLKVTTGLSAENIDRVAAAARNAAEYTVFTPPEAIEGAKRLNLAVRDTGATVAALRPVLMMAQAFMGKNVAGAADLAARTMGAFNLDASELEPTLNKLVAGARAVGVQVSQLEGGMGKLGVAASRVGSGFEDTFPAYLLAVKGGLSAEEAATGLKTALGRLSDPKVSSRLAAALGVVVSKGGEFSSVRDMMLSLAEASETSGLSHVEYSQAIGKAFGDRAIKPIMVNVAKLNKGILDQNGNLLRGAEAWDFIARDMNNSTSMLTDASEEAMKPFGAQLALMMESMKNLAEVALKPILEILKPLVSTVSTVASGVRKLFQDFGAFSTVLSFVFGNIVGGIGIFAALVGGLMAVAGVSRILRVAWNFLTTSNVTMLSGLRASTMGLREWARAAKDAAVSGTGFGKVAKTFGAFALRAVGWFAGLSMVFSLVKEGWSWLKENTGIGHADKFSAKYRKDTEAQFFSATSAQIQAINSNIQSVTTLQKTANSLDAILARAAAAEKAKMPVLSFATLNKMESKLGMLGRSGAIDEGAVGRGKYQLDIIREVMNKAAQGLTPSESEMQKAQEAMSLMNLGLKSRLPLDHKLQQEMDGMNQAMQTALSASKEVGNGLMFLSGKGSMAADQLEKTVKGETDRLSVMKAQSLAYIAQNFAIDAQVKQLKALKEYKVVSDVDYEHARMRSRGTGIPMDNKLMSETGLSNILQGMKLAPQVARAIEQGMMRQRYTFLGAELKADWSKHLGKALSGEPGLDSLGFSKGAVKDPANALLAGVRELEGLRTSLRTSSQGLENSTNGMGETLKGANTALGYAGRGPLALPSVEPTAVAQVVATAKNTEAVDRQTNELRKGASVTISSTTNVLLGDNSLDAIAETVAKLNGKGKLITVTNSGRPSP